MIRLDKTLHLTLKGDCIVKKNSTGKLWYRTLKVGNGVTRKIPLSQPVIYYKDSYKKWIKENLATVIQFKETNNITAPIDTPVFFTCIFYLSRHTKVDITNLLESPQDLLSGNAGKFLGKNFNHDSYKILSDDNSKIIKTLSFPIIFYDKDNPRTEVLITPFNLAKFYKVLNYIFGNKIIMKIFNRNDLFN